MILIICTRCGCELWRQTVNLIWFFHDVLNTCRFNFFLCALRLLCWRLQHDDESKEHHWFRSRMGIYAERDNKVKEHSWRQTWATVQLRRLHDALYVCCFFCSPLLSHLYNSILVPFRKLRLCQSLPCHVSCMLYAELSITCAPRNLHMIILNSYMINTGNLLKITLHPRWELLPSLDHILQ